MKLWLCSASIEVVIASETEPTDFEIQEAAEDEVRDSSLEADGFPRAITKLGSIPQHWRDSLPRGDIEETAFDDMTCEEILEEIERQRLEKAANSPMPNQTSLPLGNP